MRSTPRNRALAARYRDRSARFPVRMPAVRRLPARAIDRRRRPVRSGRRWPPATPAALRSASPSVRRSAFGLVLPWEPRAAPVLGQWVPPLSRLRWARLRPLEWRLPLAFLRRLPETLPATRAPRQREPRWQDCRN